MTVDPEDIQTRSKSEADDFVAAGADRPPTPEEEAAAERAAAGVDLGSVTAHEQEMAEKGKNVKGEGQLG